MSTPYHLLPIWRIATDSPVERLNLSADGQYIVAQGAQTLTYANWSGTVLWQGERSSDINHLLVSSTRTGAIGASEEYVRTFDSKGALTGGGKLAVDKLALHVNGSSQLIVGANSRRVMALGMNTADRADEDCAQHWSHDFRESVIDLAISPDGEQIVVGTSDQTLTALGRKNSTLWSVPAKTVCVAVAGSMVIVADTEKMLYAFDLTTHQQFFQHPLETVPNCITINARGNYIVMGMDSGMQGFFFHNLAVAPIIRRPSRDGLRPILESLSADSVLNLYMNHDGGCVVIEVEGDPKTLKCYDLEGNLLWNCPKPEFTKEVIYVNEETDDEIEEIVRPSYPSGPSTEELLIREIRTRFTDYTISQGRNLQEDWQTQTNIYVGFDRLDLFFSGKGYLFVTRADATAIARATRIADQKRCRVYIIAYYADSAMVNYVKTAPQAKKIELYCLSDMKKTSGFLNGSPHFETFILTTGNRFSNF